MASLTAAAISEPERRVLDGIVALLREELGDELRAVWLYGSRARGQRSGPESDVDILVVTEGGRARDFNRVYDALHHVAAREGVDPMIFDPRVVDPAWVQGRRQIESFFILEVDRDKIVLAGEP